MIVLSYFPMMLFVLISIHYRCHFVAATINNEELSSEPFTSLIDMEDLVAIAFKLDSYLDDYIRTEELRLQRIKSYFTRYRKLYEEINLAKQPIDAYMSNPVLKYLLIKTATIDWDRVKPLIDSSCKSEVSKRLGNLITPTASDVRGEATNLLQLQSTYKLNTSIMARGELLAYITDIQSSQEMFAGDCWELGRQAYLMGEDHISLSWTEESLRRYEKQDRLDETVSMEDILRVQAFAAYKIGDKKKSLQMTNELLEHVPDSKRNSSSLYLRDMFDREEKLRAGIVAETAKVDRDDLYNSLCRGENLMDPKTEAQLHCSLFLTNDPFYFLQPVKREQVSLKPVIVIYHNVLSDKEIQELKELAPPDKLEKTIVLSLKSGAQGPSTRQSSTGTRMWYHNSEISDKIGWERVKRISGLETTSSFGQLMRYGVGGQFTPHHDYIGEKTPLNELQLINGDRMGTWLYYLNDVEAGGNTVFLKPKVFIRPEKGSAAFWYNYFPNGDPNPDTLHAGCPVLQGNKWTWATPILMHGQEFRRPCRTNRYAEM